tara:strand:+ start:192 stop:524 length:333 start_codon:yes stop_codon:yes gene_type:complete
MGIKIVDVIGEKIYGINGFPIRIIKNLVIVKKLPRKNLEKQNIFRILSYINKKLKTMRKYIRALEIPFYLFVIAFACLERGNTGMAIILMIISIGRLIVNVSFDEFIYKK